MELNCNTPPVTFGGLIRQRRRQLGLTLIQLQDRIGVHNSRISRWERGLQLPTHPDRLSRLAHGLNLPLEDLYAAAGYEVPGISSLGAYLRQACTTNLPDKAIDEVASAITKVVARYGATFDPTPSNRAAPASKRSRRHPRSDHDQPASHP